MIGPFLVITEDALSVTPLEQVSSIRISNGTRSVVGEVPVQGSFIVTWKASVNAEYYEVAIIPDGKTIDEVPVIICGVSAVKSAFYDSFYFDEMPYDAASAGLVLNGLLPNKDYIVAVRSVRGAERTDFVYSSGISTGTPKVAAVSNVVITTEYRLLRLSWANSDGVYGNIITITSSTGVFDYYIKADNLIAKFPEGTTISQIKITPHNTELQDGTVYTDNTGWTIPTLAEDDSDYSDKKTRVEDNIDVNSKMFGNVYDATSSTILVDSLNKRLGDHSAAPIIGIKGIVSGYMCTDYHGFSMETKTVTQILSDDSYTLDNTDGIVVSGITNYLYVTNDVTEKTYRIQFYELNTADSKVEFIAAIDVADYGSSSFSTATGTDSISAGLYCGYGNPSLPTVPRRALQDTVSDAFILFNSNGHIAAIFDGDEMTLPDGTITGGLIRTAASGKRVEMNKSTNSVKVYGTGGNLALTLDGDEVVFSNTYGIMTGGLFRTSSGTGQRIEIRGSNNTIKFFNSSNVEIIKIDDDLFYSLPGVQINEGILYLPGSLIVAEGSAGALGSESLAFFRNTYAGIDGNSISVDGYLDIAGGAYAFERIGVRASSIVTGSSSADKVTAVKAIADGEGTGLVKGIDIIAAGSTGDTYGIHVTASSDGSGTAYAGFFEYGLVKINDNVINKDIFYPKITVSGDPSFRVWTITISKNDAAVSSRIGATGGVGGVATRGVVRLWVSLSAFGDPTEITGTGGAVDFSVSTGNLLDSAFTETSILSVVSDASGVIVINGDATINSTNATAVYLMVEIDGIVYSASGTIYLSA